MKVCSRCKVNPVRSLNQYSCKECHNGYQKAYYKTHPQSINKSAQKRKQERIELVRSYKNKPCVDCKKQYPYYVMDFDHLGNKKFNLSTVSTKAFSKRAIIEELEKCELVCANCHRVRTFERQIGMSSSGKTAAFEAEIGGSNPSIPAV